MAGSGRAASPNARRRNARPEFRRLPAAGRQGDPPAWPLGRPTKAEQSLWAQLWASPQAVVWEELGWIRVVARYTRTTVTAEEPLTSRKWLTLGIKPTAVTQLMAEARQLEDRLGLNPKAMKTLGWEVSGATAVEDTGDAPVVDIDSFRARVS
jgi:hypothetical protein